MPIQAPGLAHSQPYRQLSRLRTTSGNGGYETSVLTVIRIL